MTWGKLKQNYTGATIITEAQALRNTLRQSEIGHREVVRSTLQSVQITLVRIRANKKLQESFLRELRRRDGEENGHRVNFELEFMTIVTGTSRVGRQRASKYCKVLKVLGEAGVEPQNIAREIKSRGGIERIVSQKGSATATARKDQHRRDTEIIAPLQPRHRTNDQEVRCVIVMRLSDQDRILKTRAGTTLTLDVLRIGQSNADLKLRRIHDASTTASDDDEADEDDW
jgi:hypothetical protein